MEPIRTEEESTRILRGEIPELLNTFDPSKVFDHNRRNHANYDRYIKGRYYLFLTKPDLNLPIWERRLTPIPSRDEAGRLTNADEQSVRAQRNNVENFSFFKHISTRYSDIIGSLNQSSIQAPVLTHTSFIPAITNLALGFPAADVSSDPITYTETFTGDRMMLGKDAIESQLSSTFSLEFVETANTFITLLFKTWIDYISFVIKGLSFPKVSHIYNRRVDYTSSLFCFGIAPDGETIQYYAKYTGVFPNSLGMSGYEEQLGTSELVTIPIGFQYNGRDEMDPVIFRDFNAVASNNQSLMINPTGEGPYTASSRFELRNSSNPDRFENFGRSTERPLEGGAYMYAEPEDNRVHTPTRISGFPRVRVVQKTPTDQTSATENRSRYILRFTD